MSQPLFIGKELINIKLQKKLPYQELSGGHAGMLRSYQKHDADSSSK